MKKSKHIIYLISCQLVLSEISFVFKYDWGKDFKSYDLKGGLLQMVTNTKINDDKSDDAVIPNDFLVEMSFSPRKEGRANVGKHTAHNY